jgi:hypothetical protein
MPTIPQAQAAFFSQGGFKGGTDKGKVYYVKTGKGQAKADFSKAYGGLGIVQALVAQYISEFLTAAAENLKKTESVTTGKLVESLDFDLETTSTGYVINFTALDYYKFVDQGVKGTGDKSGKGLKYTNKNNSSPYAFKFMNPSKKHVDAIKKWITDNDLTSRVTDISKWGGVGRENKGGNMPLKSAAWFVARQIKMGGLKATNFWKNAFDETFKDFGQKMSEALGQSITVNLEQMAKEIKSRKGTKIPK